MSQATTATITPTGLDYSKDQAIKRICVVNRLQQTSISEQEIMKALKSLQDGLKKEFLYYHGFSAKLYYAGPTVKEPTNMWNMVLLDTSDVAGALGYHDNNSAGIPQGKIFCKTAKDYGANWTITLDHEIKEALADPWGMDAYFDANNKYLRLIAWEVGDPCEADKYGYQNNGVGLSNFVTPFWKHPFNDTAELDSVIRYDARGLINRSFQTLPGCHQSYYYISGGPNGQSGWVDKNFKLGQLSDFKDEYELGQELDVYSDAQQGTNWHILFKTPTQKMIDEFKISIEEVFDAMDSAFNPPPGSRRDIRYKMSESGPAALVENDDNKIQNKFNLTSGGTSENTDVTAIDDSFDEIVSNPSK